MAKSGKDQDKQAAKAAKQWSKEVDKTDREIDNLNKSGLSPEEKLNRLLGR